MANVLYIIHFMLLLTFPLSQADIQGPSLLEDKQISFDSYERTDPPDNFNRKNVSNNGPLKKLTCYSCVGIECMNPKLCHDAVTCWKSTVRNEDGTETIRRDCSIETDHIPFLCNKIALNNKYKVSHYVECCYTDLCNRGSFPILEPLNDNTDESLAIRLPIAILGPILGLGALMGGAWFCLKIRKIRRKRSFGTEQNKLLVDLEMESSILNYPSSSSTSTSDFSHELQVTAAGDSTLKEYLDGQSLTSGSGSGLPLLVQQTLAKQVTLVECLGNGGGFGGKVWRGVWHGENVAVKIYLSHDEAAWARETEIYSQFLSYCHDNILGYIGSDMASGVSCTQLWLVTHYHPLGSLFDYLNRSLPPLTHHQTLNICLEIINGLLYLHMEIHGTKEKPSIVHRNLKSKNILLKTNGGYVIADFSLAMTQNRLMTERVDLRHGTKRYMSPEVLKQTINVECLESFKRTDIYSLGLIMWEVCRRCISNGITLDYAAPYSEWLSSSFQEPSIEEMRKLVVLDQRRPPLLNRWHSDPILSGMGKLMQECWYNHPTARLSILRVKKTLLKLAANDSRIHLPHD